MEKRHIFLSFLTKVLEMPLWVKEILYVELKKNVEENNILLLDEKGNIEKESLYQNYLPTLTYVGKKELANHAEGHPENVYKFLEYSQSGANILQTTINNFWTLEETAVVNVICLEKQYVTPPASLVAKTMLVYLSGRIRFGEYFKRLGRINVDQLETALRKQKELENQGQKVGIASVMINLGYITDEESKTVLHLKDESKKRFIFDPELIGKIGGGAPPVDKPSVVSASGVVAFDSEMAARLSKENKYLKIKLEAIGKILSGE